MTTDSLTGRVALVTGASSGIGAAISHALATRGARVHLVARNRDRLQRASERCPDSAFHVCDVLSADAVSALAAEVGELDVLVNAAGVVNAGRILELDPASFDETIATNLRGPFLLCRAFAPSLTRRRGTIVNLSSVAARRSFAGMAAYAASKAGLSALSGVLREELRADGVRVVDVIAGAVDTPIWESFWADAPRERMMTADDVARAVVDAATAPASVAIEEIVLRPVGGDL